jgi:hypothetical protein
MTTRKATSAKAVSPAPSTPAPATTTTRKPWIKKTTVEVVLDQIGKQEAKVNELREVLKHEERELAKLEQAKKVLEAV